MHWLRLTTLLIILCHYATPGMAQQQAPMELPELMKLREQYILRAITSATKLAEQYTKALAVIEQESGAAGDYEQALKARLRRLDLTNLYTRVQNANTQNNSIVLLPSAARPNGAVSFDRSRDALINWRSTTSSASWDVAKITPGTYIVSIMYSVAPYDEPLSRNGPYLRTGGDFEFYEDSSLPGASLNRRTATVSDTGGWTQYRTLTLTAMNLTRTSSRFVLKIVRPHGEGDVMRLKSIRFFPVAPVVTTVTSEATDILKSAEDAHVQNLRLLAAPIVDSYLATLRSALAAATDLNKKGTVADLQQEITRATKWLDHPHLAIRTNPHSEGSGDSNMKWEDALYLSNPENTGDRFSITYLHQQTTVKLTGIACPPISEDALSELQTFAAYFNVSPEDALKIGRMARDFTASYLAAKQLNLQTDGEKDLEGNLLVTIHPSSMGDFAGVLVDNGLAAVIEPVATKGKTPPSEDSSYLALKERESAARKRPNPPGGWALSEER